MDRLATATLLAACFLFAAPLANALTLDQALLRAREQGPAVLAARARIAEARGRLTGASMLLRENPTASGAAGQRHGDDDHSFAGEVGIAQNFEIAGQRGARVDGAEAGVARATAASEDSERRLLRAVAVAFYDLLYAQQSRELAGRSEDVAGEVARIADRRYRAEDVPLLDANLSRAAHARARAERMGAEARVAAAQGELRTLLGMAPEESLAAEGELHPAPFDRATLTARSLERADLRAIASQLEQAEAERRLARRESLPDIGLGARYERDEGDDIALGEVSVPIPLFDRAQGRRAEAAARVRRLRLELDAARRAAHVELESALAVHAQRMAAVSELESAVPLLDENESLARRSYEAGELGLAELLLVRRETLETRREHLDRVREAAVAAVDARAAAGALE